MPYNHETFAAHRERFAAIVRHVHHYAAAIVLLTFASYGLAAWVWFRGEAVAALVIATLSYLFFRRFHSLAYGLARAKLRDRPGFAETLALIDGTAENTRLHDVLSGIEAGLRKE